MNSRVPVSECTVIVSQRSFTGERCTKVPTVQPPVPAPASLRSAPALPAPAAALPAPAAALPLVEGFDIEPYSDFSAK